MNMELNPKTIKISPHSIVRYRQRSRNSGSDQTVENTIRRSLCFSREVKLKPQFRIDVLLNHRCEETQYFKYEKFIFVVADGELKTVHNGTADRWEGI